MLDLVMRRLSIGEQPGIIRTQRTLTCTFSGIFPGSRSLKFFECRSHLQSASLVNRLVFRGVTSNLNVCRQMLYPGIGRGQVSVYRKEVYTYSKPLSVGFSLILRRFSKWRFPRISKAGGEMFLQLSECVYCAQVDRVDGIRLQSMVNES